jgi:excisionase family DNA binding protein
LSYISVMLTPLLSIKDVMEYLQIRSRTTMFKLLKDGFPHAKVGKKLIFRQADVDAWLEARIIKPRPKKKTD